MEENKINLQAVESEEGEKKTNFIWKKIICYAKEQPKKTFAIMYSLVILSVCFSFLNYFYIRNVTAVKFENSKKELQKNLAEINSSAPLEKYNNITELKADLKELEYYKTKPLLTQQDSIRIKYLIDKNKRRNE